MCQQLDEVDRRGPPPLSEFPFIQQTHATVQSADQPTTRCNLDWGTLVSTNQMVAAAASAQQLEASANETIIEVHMDCTINGDGDVDLC